MRRRLGRPAAVSLTQNLYPQLKIICIRGSLLKPELKLLRLICLIGFVVFFLCTLNVVMAEDQNPPYGKDKGIWVMIEKKPDVEAEKDWDNGIYYDNHVSLSGTTVKGGYS
jgi:hypothetical protein